MGRVWLGLAALLVGLAVAVPDAELPALTAEQVRDTLERVRWR